MKNRQSGMDRSAPLLSDNPSSRQGSRFPFRRSIFFLLLSTVIVVPLFLFLSENLCSQPEKSRRPPSFSLKLLATYPHDKSAFTQGLFFEDGFLWESTGEYGRSTLRKVEPETGDVVKRFALPERYFAEGIEVVGDWIYQLTWREGICFVYDKKTFQPARQYRYSGEGWGLAYDGESLIMSDGTATLRFLDPDTFKEKRRLTVTDRDSRSKKKIPVRFINEMEFIHGEIWANIWQSTRIARIDPQNGNVLGWIDCSAFVPEECRIELFGPAVGRERVLNGIAFDKGRDRVYLTGKNWPVLYEFELTDL